MTRRSDPTYLFVILPAAALLVIGCHARAATHTVASVPDSKLLGTWDLDRAQTVIGPAGSKAPGYYKPKLDDQLLFSPDHTVYWFKLDRALTWSIKGRELTILDLQTKSNRLDAALETGNPSSPPPLTYHFEFGTDGNTILWAPKDANSRATWKIGFKKRA